MFVHCYFQSFYRNYDISEGDEIPDQKMFRKIRFRIHFRIKIPGYFAKYLNRLRHPGSDCNENPFLQKKTAIKIGIKLKKLKLVPYVLHRKYHSPAADNSGKTESLYHPLTSLYFTAETEQSVLIISKTVFVLLILNPIILKIYKHEYQKTFWKTQ